MRTPRTIAIITVLIGALTLPALADAQARGRAVPRPPAGGPVAGPSGGAPPPRVVGRPPGGGAPPYGGYRGYGRPYYPYYPAYRSGVSIGFAYGYPWGPWGLGIGVGYGYGYPGWYGGWAGYGYPYYGGYYPYYGYAVPAYGGVRIDVPQKSAEVLVDGYFVGVVDDFDGSFQQVNLEPGPHRIEVRASGFEPVAFDVNVTPGRTVTYRAGLRPAAP